MPTESVFHFSGTASTLAGLLTLAALLTLVACQTQRPQVSAPTDRSPAGPEPAAPSPVPFRPVPPEPTSAPLAAPAAPAPVAPSQQKPASTTPKAPIKASTPTVAPEPKPAAAAPATVSPVAAKPASLDLNSLEQRLKDTRAIGIFTKLSLKNQVDDLLGELREFHKGSPKLAQPALRQKYDLLMMKVLSLLQGGDPPLASAIASSREAIWQILMDPSKFAKI